ncbi:MAG: tyrosine-type recombinase/integrase [Verrucomicrobiae bacterium]|nr:tyrosine-type recombinase/integrase [Verrucomicrobiae bacterium]
MIQQRAKRRQDSSKPDTKNPRHSGAKVHVVKVGSVAVKIYERARIFNTPQGKPVKRTLYQVVDYSQGTRRVLDRLSFETAEAEAQRLARQIAGGQTTAAALHNRDAASYGRAMEFLRPRRLTLELVASTYAQAYDLLGGDLILEAAKEYARRHAKRTPRTVAEVAAEWLALQTQRGKSQRYLEDLRTRLPYISKAFALDVARVTTGDLQRWLDSMKAAPRTVKNYRAMLGGLFKFAEARGYLPKGDNPVSGTEQVQLRHTDPIEIYAPAELRRLLQAASPDFQPALALQAFAGLRSAEVLRLDWSDIKLRRGHIQINAEQAKTGSRRLVPIADNLRAWLERYARKSGLVFPHSRAYFHELQAKTAQATATADAPALQWKHNALRHSYISYRVAETGDVARIALEAGNSATMIFRHYRELVTPEEALSWFELRPEANGNPPPRLAVPERITPRRRILQRN